MARAENEEAEAPKYPAAVVIQGTAMLSSDPLRCQSGEGKVKLKGQLSNPSSIVFAAFVPLLDKWAGVGPSVCNGLGGGQRQDSVR